MASNASARRSRLLAVLLPAAAVLAILLAVQLIYARRETEFVQLEPREGFLDVSRLDLTDQVFTIANRWDFYPEKLYDSEDFARGVEAPSSVRPNAIPYGTHRLVLQAKPRQYLTLCGYSTDYGSRVLVNGVEAARFGTVTDDPATSVPLTDYQTIPFYTGEDGLVEFIIQYNNFVHNDGGTIHATYLSTPQNIDAYKTGTRVVSVTLGGGLLALALYFLLYAAVLRRRSYLYLSLCCLVFALRDQLFAFICLFPPTLPWAVEYRMNITVVNLLPVALLLLLGSLFPRGRAWPRRVYLGGEAVFLLLIALVDTRQLVAVNVASYLWALPYLLLLIFRIVRCHLRQKSLPREEGLALAGFGILFGALVLEGLGSSHSAVLVRHGLSPSAMLLFVFLVALSISLQLQAQEAALIQSRSRSQTLEWMNTMNVDFLHKVAHELKTPLTVISGYAQLTGLQLATDHISAETPENLKTIHLEAMRLADIVTSLMDYSGGKPNNADFHPVSIPELMKSAQSICTPVCMKNNNRVVVSGIDGFVYGSGEMLLQVFINLAVNANRHTKNGVITISAHRGEEDGMVVFRVADTGAGIDPLLLPHIFEKGCSDGGGTGLGLSICSEAVAAHGGRIWVEHTGPKGTSFAFTVPRTEE